MNQRLYIIIIAVILIILILSNPKKESFVDHISTPKLPRRVLTNEELTRFTTTSSSGEIVMVGSNGVLIDQGYQAINVTTTDIVLYAGSDANTERVRLLGSNGNLGVGVTNPSQRLSVGGDASFTGSVAIGSNTLSGKASVQLASPASAFGVGSTSYDTNSVVVGNIGSTSQSGALTLSYNQANNTAYLGAAAPTQGYRDLAYGAKTHKFYTNATVTGTPVSNVGLTSLPVASLSIDSTGKVGISNNNPATALDVNGTVTATSGVNLNSSSLVNGNAVTFNSGVSRTAYEIRDMDQSTSPQLDYLRIGRKLNDDMVINNQGYVGIGTSSPFANLHVNGKIIFSGTGLLGGSTYPLTLNTGGQLVSMTTPMVFSSGEANYIPIFNSVSTISKSVIYQNLTSIGIATTICNSTLTVNGTASVSGNTTIGGTASVGQTLTVASGGAAITGNTSITGTASVGQALTVSSGGAAITGNTSITGTASVGQALTVSSGGAAITGNTSITGTASVGQALTVASGGAAITGTSTVNGNLSVGIGVTTNPAATLDVLGNVQISSSSTNSNVMISTGLGSYTGIQAYNSNNTSKLPITLSSAGGGVGIGTTAVPSVLTVNGTPSSTGLIYSQSSSNLGTTAGNYDVLQRWTEKTSASSSDTIDLNWVRTTDGTDTTTAGKRIQSKTDSTWQGYMQFNGSTLQNGISFGTGSSTTGPNAVSERMRIDSTGNVGINTTSTSSYLLNVNGTSNMIGKSVFNGGIQMTTPNMSNAYVYMDSNGNFTTAAGVPGGVSGSFTTGYVPLATSAANLGNSVIYQSGSNVGIGTAAPTGLLSIYSTTADYTNSLVVKTAWPSVYLDGTATTGGRIWSIINGGTGAGIGKGNFGIYDGTSGVGSYRFMINSSGNIGINNVNPIGMLTVGDSSVDGSTGTIVIAKKSGSSSRHFRMGIDSNFAFAIGDYGYNNGAGSWIEQFQIAYSCPNNTLVMDSAGNINNYSREIVVNQCNGPGQFRMIAGSYGSFIRNDGITTYFLCTYANDQYGQWSGIRPFYFNNASGYVTMENGARVNGGLSASSIASSNYVSADGYIYSGSYMQSNSYIYAAGHIQAGSHFHSNNYIWAASYVQAGSHFYSNNYMYAAGYIQAGNYMYASNYIQSGGDVYVGGSLRLPNGWRITTTDGHFRVYHNDEHKMTMHSWTGDALWDNTFYVSPGGIKVDAYKPIRLGIWEMSGSNTGQGDFGIYSIPRSDYGSGGAPCNGGGMSLMGRFGGSIYGTVYNANWGRNC